MGWLGPRGSSEGGEKCLDPGCVLKIGPRESPRRLNISENKELKFSDWKSKFYQLGQARLWARSSGQDRMQPTHSELGCPLNIQVQEPSRLLEFGRKF